MQDDPDLGPLLFECEKYPARDIVVRASGGWPKIIILQFIYIPLISLPLTGGILVLFNDKLPAPPAKRLVLGLWLSVFLLLFAGMGFLWKRAYRQATLLAVAVYEKGIAIRKLSGTVSRTYEQMSDIYFGTKNRRFARGMDFMARYHEGWRFTKDSFSARLTVEFNDGSKVRLPALMCFTDKSVNDLLECFLRMRPDLLNASCPPTPRR